MKSSYISQHLFLVALCLGFLLFAGWPATSHAATNSAASSGLSNEASSYLRSLQATNANPATPSSPAPDAPPLGPSVTTAGPSVPPSSVPPSSVAPSSVAPSSVAPSSVPAPSPNTMETLDDKHHLAIGDRISFRIEEDLADPKEPLDPKSLIVTDSGEIEVPYLGRVQAEVKTCKQLAGEIKTLLEKDYYHQATVLLSIDLKAKTRGKVYIVGAVHMAGPQDIPSDEVLTLGKAIMRAGGFNDFADRRNVKVTRKPAQPDSEKRTFAVDVGEIFDKGKVERDLTLEPGDLILVTERAIRF